MKSELKWYLVRKLGSKISKTDILNNKEVYKKLKEYTNSNKINDILTYLKSEGFKIETNEHAEYIKEKSDKRTTRRTVTDNSCTNDMIIYNDYAEIVICSNNIETARVIIDLDDVNLIKQYKWFASIKKTGKTEVSCVIDRKFISLRRFLINMEVPVGYIIAHRDRDCLNYRKDNLIITTQVKNSKHNKTPKTNTSGYKGVYLNKKYGKWMAKIVANKKVIYLGTYLDKEDAIRVRKEAEEKYYNLL